MSTICGPFIFLLRVSSPPPPLARETLKLVRDYLCLKPPILTPTTDCARLAAENWTKHGNFLGTNEIAGLMFHRDVMVLGLSDGVMCGATGFGLVLQKLVNAGVVNWNKEGWIIQSVSDENTDLVKRLLIVLLGVGADVHRPRPRVDLIPRVALDAHSFLRAPWSCHAHEAAFVCIL